MVFSVTTYSHPEFMVSVDLEVVVEMSQLQQSKGGI